MKAISLVFVNGQFSQELSDMTQLPDHVHRDFSSGLSLTIPKHVSLSLPLHIKLIGDGDYSFTQELFVEEDAAVNIIAEYSGNVAHIHSQFQLKPSAKVNYYQLQREECQQADIHVMQYESSCLHIFFADTVDMAKRSVHVKLQEPFAECHLRGLYYLTADLQTLSQNILIEHVAKYSKSSMLFKGILDKKSSAAFVGKVYVHQDAQHIDAKQATHHLLLSNDAEAKAKPELEIYADDVKCTHAATVGQLDEEALFYLQSRGIEKSYALQLLTQAFANDLIQQIDDPVIKQYIQPRAMAYAEL